MIPDDKFCQFLELLASNVKGKNGLILTEWESQFLGTYLGLPTGAFYFTEGRRAAMDRMWRRYGPELNHPHPLDRVTERPTLAPADAEGCEYLVREDGRQQRCNVPAEFQEPGRLRYCRMHGEAVVRDMKRAGKTVRLIKFP